MVDIFVELGVIGIAGNWHGRTFPSAPPDGTMRSPFEFCSRWPSHGFKVDLLPSTSLTGYRGGSRNSLRGGGGFWTRILRKGGGGGVRVQVRGKTSEGGVKPPNPPPPLDPLLGYFIHTSSQTASKGTFIKNCPLSYDTQIRQECPETVTIREASAQD